MRDGADRRPQQDRQLIVLVNIRVPSDTHMPVALVQLPLGLNLPAGAKFQVDDGKPVELQIQTCENRGCYASAPIPPDLLAALKSGKQLNVSFQNLGKETITIPMPLTDFGAAFDKINNRNPYILLPGHFGGADAVAVELLVLVHGDRHPQQFSGEFERRLVMRHRARTIAPDVEAGPRDEIVESKLGLQRARGLAIDQ